MLPAFPGAGGKGWHACCIRMAIDVLLSRSFEVIMDSFAPEFSRFWLLPEKGERIGHDGLDDDMRTQQQRALEELAERVTAARTVV